MRAMPTIPRTSPGLRVQRTLLDAERRAQEAAVRWAKRRLSGGRKPSGPAARQP